MDEPIIYPYALELDGQTYAVLSPEGEPGYRVRLPDGQVTGIPGDPTSLLTTEALSGHLTNPPELVPSVEQVWADFLAGYIEDSVTGFKLKANRAARNDFTGQATLLQAALAVGAVTAESPVSIWDKDNVEHPLTVAECLGLLVRYGLAWQSAFVQLAP